MATAYVQCCTQRLAWRLHWATHQSQFSSKTAASLDFRCYFRRLSCHEFRRSEFFMKLSIRASSRLVIVTENCDVTIDSLGWGENAIDGASYGKLLPKIRSLQQLESVYNGECDFLTKAKEIFSPTRKFHLAMSNFFRDTRHERKFFKTLTRDSGCSLLDNRLDALWDWCLSVCWDIN